MSAPQAPSGFSPALDPRLTALEALVLSDPGRARRELLTRLSAAREEGDGSNEAYALCLLGGCAFFQGNYPETLVFAEYSLALSRKLGLLSLQARCVNALGLAAQSLGRYDESLEHYVGSLKLANQVGDDLACARALVNAASSYSSLEEHEQALELYRASAKILVRLNHTHYLTDARRGIVEELRRLDQGEEARALLPEVLEVAERFKFQRIVCSLCMSQALLLLDSRALQEALRTAERGLRAAQDIGDYESISRMHWLLGECHFNLADYAQARASLTTAERLTRLIGHPSLEADVKRSLSKLCEVSGEYRMALSYFKECTEITDALRARGRTRRIYDLSQAFQVELRRVLKTPLAEPSVA